MQPVHRKTHLYSERSDNLLELAERIRQQNEEAYIETMQLYGEYLTRTAFLLLKDYQLSQEIVQDTFLNAFQKNTSAGKSGSAKSLVNNHFIKSLPQHHA